MTNKIVSAVLALMASFYAGLISVETYYNLWIHDKDMLPNASPNRQRFYYSDSGDFIL